MNLSTKELAIGELHHHEMNRGGGFNYAAKCGSLQDPKSFLTNLVQNGLLEPIMVRKIQKGYEVIKGGRRLWGMLEIRKTMPGMFSLVSCIILPEKLPANKVALLLHDQGLQVGVSRWARIRQIWHLAACGISQETIASQVNLGIAQVKRAIKLLELPGCVQTDYAKFALDNKTSPLALTDVTCAAMGKALSEALDPDTEEYRDLETAVAAAEKEKDEHPVEYANACRDRDFARSPEFAKLYADARRGETVKPSGIKTKTDLIFAIKLYRVKYPQIGAALQWAVGQLKDSDLADKYPLVDEA